MSQDGLGYMTEERRMIRDTARDFTMKEVLPVANKLDGPDGEIPMDLRQKMADMGYFGITIPRGVRRARLGNFRVLPGRRATRARMDVGGVDPRTGARWMDQGGHVQREVPQVPAARGER